MHRGGVVGPPLERVAETKLATLLGRRPGARLEASGVLARDGRWIVVLDNTHDVAVIDPPAGAQHAAPGTVDLDGAVARARMLPRPAGLGTGYEDLARDPVSGRVFLLVESLPQKRGGRMAWVEECDAELRPLGGAWLDFPIASANKGMEGLTAVHRDGRLHLLGLCEGNWCRGGAQGRRPGGGRIQVFARAPGHETGRWLRVDTIELPGWLPFIDYSGLSMDGDRLAVVSQESSMLWVGRLRPDAWQVDGPGSVHPLPRDGTGGIVYCTVEGVSWVGADRLVMVSDRAKPGRHEARCRAEEQSVHLFELPRI
jgi:hypothetical protein